MKSLPLFLLGAAWLCSGGCSLAAPDAIPAAVAGAVTATETSPALADFPLSKAPYLAAYHWGAANATGGARANEAYSRWINRPAVWAEDFEPTDAWENNIEGGGWQLGEWRDWKKVDPANRRLILSVPLLPGGWDRSGPKRGEGAGQSVSLEAGAKGDYNAHFVALAQNLVSYGLGDSVLRLGWEFNGGWYTFRASDNPKAWAEYWRQIVTTMRGVKGAEKLQFCWNPALGWQQFPAELAYPGDDYVDIVGLDVYDESWGQDTYPLPAGASADEIEKRRDKAWNDVIYGGNMGIKWWSDFAHKHGKLFAFPEWSISKREDGHGGLDNPVFVERMHKFITDPANNVYFSCHFDVQAGDGHHQLSTGPSEDETNEFPLSAARFRELFAQTDAAIPGSGTGLSATFFADKTLSKVAATAMAPTLDFDWNAQTPPAGVSKTAPGARFAGQVQALEGGTYTFRAVSNGQSRLWVNDTPIFDGAKGTQSGTIKLVAGQKYAIKQELVGASQGKLEWKRPGATAFETVPGTQLYPQMGDGTGLTAAYFSGANFETLETTRTDKKVDFWWGEGSPSGNDGKPMENVGPDHWSVRWTGEVQTLEGGDYTFATNTDDGVRLWVNGQLLIDHWIGGPQTSTSNPIALEAGHKYAIKMEYFDDTQGANARLSWTRPGHTVAQTIPTSQLFPAP